MDHESVVPRPLARFGADSPFGLALPPAQPTRGQLYAPRGVLLARDGERTALVAADTGHHRLLVWPDVRSVEREAAAVVGQPDATTEGPQAGGRGPERGLHLPTGLAVARGPDGAALLLVADGWHHRVLGFTWPVVADDPEPVWVLGQDGLSPVEPNAGGEAGLATLYWPFGVTWHDGWLWVADTGNRRVLGWAGLPGSPTRPADVVLGQPSPHVRDENRGGPPAPDSFRWPHQVAVLADGTFWVADAGNHRVLGWPAPPDTDGPADRVLGQRDLVSTWEQPHVPQGPGRLRFPYGAVPFGTGLAVADTANNRVLIWAGGPRDAASAVLGQDDFAGSGENRWRAVTEDSLCWPYGLSAATDAAGTLLAVADSGNNRVVVWS
jgi:hypothetical protein